MQLSFQLGVFVGENIITWNFTNWITIVLMATLGFVILGVASQAFHKSTGGQYAAN
jgi:hypothetical protein